MHVLTKEAQEADSAEPLNLGIDTSTRPGKRSQAEQRPNDETEKRRKSRAPLGAHKVSGSSSRLVDVLFNGVTGNGEEVPELG